MHTFVLFINFSVILETYGECLLFYISAIICGVMAIVMAFMASNLGTIFEATYSISGAIKAPVDGIFFAGMTAPWVSTKVSYIIYCENKTLLIITIFWKILISFLYFHF